MSEAERIVLSGKPAAFGNYPKTNGVGVIVNRGAVKVGGFLREAVGIHTKTLPDGRLVDVRKLWGVAEGRKPEKRSMKELKARKLSRSSRTGFSKKRYDKADTSIPPIVAKNGFVLDGRHRIAKQLDQGRTHAKVVRVSDDEIESAVVKSAGLARRFRVDRALNNAERLGKATPKLRFDQEVAALKVQRRGSRLAEEGLRTGDFGRYERHAKVAAFFTPRRSFPYRGDLRTIALDPESGMPHDRRLGLLEEHYLRLGNQPPATFLGSTGMGTLRGAGLGAGVAGLKSLQALRGAGAGWRDAARASVRPGLSGALIGGFLGAASGAISGYARNVQIRKARNLSGMEAESRRGYLRDELDRNIPTGVRLRF